MFPKIVVPPNHPLKNRVFHYKPSILGYPYFCKHPNGTKRKDMYGLPLLVLLEEVAKEVTKNKRLGVAHEELIQLSAMDPARR